MRIVKPIAEINSTYSMSAWWGLMMCIMVCVVSMCLAVTVAVNHSVDGDRRIIESKNEHVEHMKILDACANEVDSSTVECVQKLDDYLGVTDPQP